MPTESVSLTLVDRSAILASGQTTYLAIVAEIHTGHQARRNP